MRERTMATRMCDVCGVRPAVVAVRRRIPGEGQTVQYLCELHAAEARGGRPPLGASSLAGMVLGGSLNPGDKVVAGAEEGLLTLDVMEGAADVPDETDLEEAARETESG
jgi:hypothetical protein